MDRRSERLIRKMLNGGSEEGLEKEKRVRFKTAVMLIRSLIERRRASGVDVPELKAHTSEEEGRAELMLRREDLQPEDMMALITAYCFSDEFTELSGGEGVSFTVYWDAPYDPLEDCLLLRGLTEDIFRGGAGRDFPCDDPEIY